MYIYIYLCYIYVYISHIKLYTTCPSIIHIQIVNMHLLYLCSWFSTEASRKETTWLSSRLCVHLMYAYIYIYTLYLIYTVYVSYASI